MFSKAIALGATVVSLASLTTWTAVLEGRGGSAVRGTATVEAVGADSARATIEVSGAKAGAEYSWHVHSGACGTDGANFGKAEKYPSIKVGPDGTASASVVIGVAAPTTGDYSVTVYKSRMNLTPVACGTLKSSEKVPVSSMAVDSTHSMTGDSSHMMPMDSMHMKKMRDTMPGRTDSMPKP